MTFTLSQLAEHCGARLVGLATTALEGAASLRNADPTKISLYSDRHYKSDLSASFAGAVITTEALAEDYSGNKLIVNDPLLAMAQVLKEFERAANALCPAPHISEQALIAPSAVIGNGVNIAAGAVIGENSVISDDVRIGSGAYIGDHVHIREFSRIDANVTVYHQCRIGKRCHVSAGTVIGADGFGFAEMKNSKGLHWLAIPQIASVLIGDDVHIGANTTIDRGSLEDTVIADDVIIDNLVQIAHNVTIGEHTAIAGCAGIAGSTRIGKNCKIGGRASILGHIEICDDVVVFADTYVTKSITRPGIYSAAMPAMPLKKWHKALARFRRG